MDEETGDGLNRPDGADGEVALDLTPAEARLLARWHDHLRGRGHPDPARAAPGRADFLAFGGLAQLERLHRVLRQVAPDRVGPLRLACREKRKGKTKRSRATGGTRGPARTLSVREDELPALWRHGLARMRAARARLDRGASFGGGDLDPPAASRIEDIAYTLRAVAAAGRAAGRADAQIALDEAAIMRWLDAARDRGNAPAGLSMQLRGLRTFVLWQDAKGAKGLAKRLAALAAEETRLAGLGRKRKDCKLAAAPLTVGDCWLAAEVAACEAEGAVPGTRTHMRLRLEAAALALGVAAPLRIGDLHRLRVGRELARDAAGWSLDLRTRKTSGEYEARLWDEVTPVLDAVLEADAPGGELWSGYDARQGTHFFSADGGETGLSADWLSDVWEARLGSGAHMIRTLWHDHALRMGSETDVWMALALCGHADGRTAEHYRTRAAHAARGREGRALLRAARRAADEEDG